MLMLLVWLKIEKVQQQLSQAVTGRRSAEADALRRAATLKQLEHRLGELSSEKDVRSNPSNAFSHTQHPLFQQPLSNTVQAACKQA